MALSERGVYWDQWRRLHRDRKEGRWWDHYCEHSAQDFHPPLIPTPGGRLSLKELCHRRMAEVRLYHKKLAEYKKSKNLL